MKVQPKRRGRPPKNTVIVTATPKRRGRPPKSTTTKKIKAAYEEATKKAAEELMIHGRITSLQGHIERLNDKIANLEHQAIGYKAVVSYLENQLGLKGSQ